MFLQKKEKYFSKNKIRLSTFSKFIKKSRKNIIVAKIGRHLINIYIIVEIPQKMTIFTA